MCERRRIKTFNSSAGIIKKVFFFGILQFVLLIGSFSRICRTDSHLISNYFQHFLKGATISKQGRPSEDSLFISATSRARRHLARHQKNSAPYRLSAGTVAAIVIPGPGYLKATDVRTAGLHLACFTSDCNTDTITRYYIPAGWIIPAIKTSSSQLNEQ